MSAVHPPNARACKACAALARRDNLDLARFVAVEHRKGFSLVRLPGVAERAATIRWVTVAP